MVNEMNGCNVTRLIENVDSMMAMENMPLENSDKERIIDCVTGKSTFEAEICKLIMKHTISEV